MAVNGINFVNQINRIDRAIATTTQKISTGTNYPSASLGAAEYAISARLTSNIGASAQSIQNTQNISAMIRTASGATANTVDALTTIREQLINAANDSNTNLDRRALQQNINQLVRQIDLNARAEYNGQRLVDGSRESLTLAGIDGYENFDLGDIRARTLGLTDAGGNVTIDASTVEAATNSLAVVADALNVAGGNLNSLQFMEDYVDEGISLNAALDEATTQGAQLQRLEYQQANYATIEENQLAAQSAINDADLAQQITNLRNQQIQQQLAIFAASIANQNRANVLNVLP